MTTTMRSPLRCQMSTSRQKGSISSAACGRLRHLQTVATWASAQVPSLGAFLGSRLASTSQLLGSPPPPSSHFTCQRCESILQVGINCSVRVRSRKKKKRSSVSKEDSPPINCILYSCHYCAFENMKLGTPKDYVKTKRSEAAARHRLAELSEGLGERTEKNSNNELTVVTKVLSTESAGSSGRKTKRKGWLSLKHLAASSADLSPTGRRPAFMRPTISTPIPRVNYLDSSKLMPRFSQADFKDVAPVLSIEEQNPSDINSIKANLELEQCITSVGDIVSKKSSNLIVICSDEALSPEQSSTFTTNGACLSASPHQQQIGVSDLFGEVALSSQCDVGCAPPINNNDGQSKASDATMGMEKQEQQQLSCYQSDAIKLDQLTAASRVFKHDQSTFAALDNFSDAVSQKNMASVSPTLLIQGVLIGKDAPTSSSSIRTTRTASVSGICKDGATALTLLLPTRKKEGVLMSDGDVAVNSSIFESARLLSTLQDGPNKLENETDKEGISLQKKRELDDGWHKVAKKLKPMAPSCLDGDLDTRRGKVSSHSATGREVQSKMKPVFRKMGRHWFTKCRSRIIKWRII